MLSNISVAGLIGAGKTTLAESLSEIMGLPLHREPVADNRLLTMFYEDMKTNAFALQIHLLNIRYIEHQRIAFNGKGSIQDRSIYEDRIFADLLHSCGFIRSIDYETYLSLFRSMEHLMKLKGFVSRL